MKPTLCLLAMLFCTQAYAETETKTAPDTIEWKDQYPSYFNGKVDINAPNPVVMSGQAIELDVRFANNEEDKPTLFSNTVFFNAFLQQQGSRLPVRLVLFDEKHKFVADFFFGPAGPQTPVTADDWCSIPIGAYVGTRIKVMSPVFSPRPGFRRGTYYLQLIYNKSFIAPRPRNKEELTEFRAHERWDELFRSNIVKIEARMGGVF